METRVVGELRVKGGGEQVPLAGGHDPLATRGSGAVGRQAGQHLDPFPDLLDQRRPDEHRPEGALRLEAQRGNGQIDDKAIDLAPEGIALDGEIHQLEEGLLAADVAREEDRPGAGAPDRLLPAKTAEW